MHKNYTRFYTGNYTSIKKAVGWASGFFVVYVGALSVPC